MIVDFIGKAGARACVVDLGGPGVVTLTSCVDQFTVFPWPCCGGHKPPALFEGLMSRTKRTGQQRLPYHVFPLQLDRYVL